MLGVLATRNDIRIGYFSKESVKGICYRLNNITRCDSDMPG